MKLWYASVNYGLEKAVGDILKTYNAQNICILESALTFLCKNEINIKCINNLFVVLKTFFSENINEAAKKASRLIFSLPRLSEETFRVIVMDCGKLRAIPQNIMVEIEKNITRQLKLAVRRANPDIEIWLNRRNNGTTYFMVRIRKHHPFNKTLQQGELRPDIVDIMLHKAKIDRQSILVDAFGGWGAIAASAIESGCYSKIYTGDIDRKCVQYQKNRFKGNRNCTVQQWDACKLPFKDRSIDSIITDPPWGEYEKINTEHFYNDFIAEFFRILHPNGNLVFLTSAKQEACQSLDKHSFLYSLIPIKINGKDTFLIYAER